MANVFQIEPGRFLGVYRSSRGPYDQGLVTAEDYWLGFARSAGIPIDAGLIGKLRDWDTEMWSKTNPQMTEWLGKLSSAGLTMILLSNMEFDMAAYARQNFHWLAYFHHKVFSCEVGLVKPDPAIFQQCIQRAGVKPQDALFVDDREENVRAARTTGITAIQFQSVKQLRADLKRMGFGVLPLPYESGDLM
jgi:putative hydrolase of the HAD superfamily